MSFPIDDAPMLNGDTNTTSLSQEETIYAISAERKAPQSDEAESVLASEEIAVEISGLALPNSADVQTPVSPEVYKSEESDELLTVDHQSSAIHESDEVPVADALDFELVEVGASPIDSSTEEFVADAELSTELESLTSEETTEPDSTAIVEETTIAEISPENEAVVAPEIEEVLPMEPSAELSLASAIVETLPETSLNEEVDEQAETEAAKEEEFSTLSRQELIKRLQAIAQRDKISDPILRKIKAAYDEQFEHERTAALATYLAEGGIEEDFEFRKDPDAIEFEQLFRMVREKRKQQLEDIDKTKRINLKQKQQLIEDLKALNDQEESNGSLDEIRRIMEKWRSIGPVPHTDAPELFKNFDFQVDKFYSRRTEFFEMKELDRRRNLERKISLLERAKKSLEESVFVNGLREYNKIYEEFRHTGPAPRDENERLYTEIKAIGTALYEKKKSYDEAQRVEAEKISVIRQGLLVQMEVVSGVVSETIAEWQTQTDLVQKLITEWKGAGSRFRDQDPEVSKRFWAGLKRFYAAKDGFFKQLDKERAENLAKKKEILARVLELVASENKFKAQTELNQLVTDWKDVGPVAYRDRDKLNKEFSKALDTFYEAKRTTVNAEQTEQRDNLAKKQALVDRLIALAAEKKGDEEEFKEIQREFQAVGFVPFKKKDEIAAAFKEALAKAIDQTGEIAQGQKAYAKLESIRGGGGGRGGRPMGPPMRKEGMGQRGILTKRITGLENDVRNYRTNMDFIASTKNGEKLKAEFNERISKAEEEINLLRTQLHDLDKPSPENGTESK